MKFLSIDAAQQFLVEVGKFDQVNTVTKDFVPPEELLELFIKGRESIIGKMKSFRRSQSSKESWRKNRYKYMKGIKSFHKSTEGKRFHRSLGRYLATRIVKGGRYGLSQEEKFEHLKGISSLRTHLYIDTVYFRPLNAQVDFDLFLDEAVIATIDEEKKLYNGVEDKFDDRDIDILCRAVDPKDLISEYCNVLGIEYKPEFLESFKEAELIEDKDYIVLLKECVI